MNLAVSFTTKYELHAVIRFLNAKEAFVVSIKKLYEWPASAIWVCSSLMAEPTFMVSSGVGHCRRLMKYRQFCAKIEKLRVPETCSNSLHRMGHQQTVRSVGATHVHSWLQRVDCSFKNVETMLCHYYARWNVLLPFRIINERKTRWWFHTTSHRAKKLRGKSDGDGFLVLLIAFLDPGTTIGILI